MHSVQVFGIVLLVFGLFLKYGVSYLASMLLPSALDSDLSSSLNVAVYVFVVLGAFMLIVGVIGSVGVCCSVKVALGTVSCGIFRYTSADKSGKGKGKRGFV